MNRRNPRIFSAYVAIIAAIGGMLAWLYVPLSLLAPAISALLIALAMLGGAILVRLARSSPITSPAAFDEEDLKRFFDSLEELSKRLFWIFIQVVFTIAVVVGVLILNGLTKEKSDWVACTPQATLIIQHLQPIASGVLVALVIWLSWKLVQMTKGDLGFIKLQREILENALKRERYKVAAKVIESQLEYKSVEPFGRSV